MSKPSFSGKQPPLIEYRNINVMRNGRKLLDNINLTIELGEHVAILGPNGAGKSSLIKTITREYYPLVQDHDAYLRILGEDSWDVFELRSRLGIVNGDLLKSSFRDITCQEMVLSGFFASTGLWPWDKVTPKMERKVKDILEFMGISSLASRYMSEVSTGESRLVLIARALVHDPPTLLLDEPTSSLDPRATHELRQTLRKIAAQGKSIIMITHNLSDIIPEIRRIIFIRHGKIIEDGKKEKVLTTDSLYRLFDLRLDITQRDGFYYHW